jgi:hypothetical protein
MGDDDLDLFHVGHYREMTTDVAIARSPAPPYATSASLVSL